MAGGSPSERQLLFDLLATSGEARPRSSFENAAWAVAAELAETSPLPEASSLAATDSCDDPIPGRADQAFRTTHAPGEQSAGEGAVRVLSPPSMQLVDPDPESQSEPVDPPLVSAPATPGPRVSAFAAATRASLAPTRAQTAHRASGPDAPEDRQAPSNAQQVAANHSDASQGPLEGTPQPDTGPSTSLDADLPTWIHAASMPSAPGAAGAALDPRAGSTGTTTDPAMGLHAHPETASPNDVPVASPAEVGRSSETATPRGGRSFPPTLDDDDDFGPLVLPEPKRRIHRRRWRAENGDDLPAVAPGPGKGRRRTAFTALMALLLLVIGFSGWLALPRDSGPGAPDTDVSMVEWRGIALPMSASAGPAERTGSRVAGFAPTARGAAIAAAHLSVRSDPAAGPEVFEPVLADQVVGARDRLADAVRAQYRAGPPAGAPGTLLGWRIDGDPAAGDVTAHLAVQHADGTRADYAIPLAWGDGDWRLDAPESGPFFPITDLDGDYQPFVEEATP